MKKFILIRAGRTAWDQEGGAKFADYRLQGTLPLPLTAEGMAELKTTAGRLEHEDCECLFSSGNESSGATAKYLAKLCRLKSKKVSALRELDCGSWQGLRMREIKERFPGAYRQWRSDPANACAPQGESMQGAYQRAAEGVAKVLAKASGETVVVVAAQIMCGLIECCLVGRELDGLWKIVEQDTPVRSFVKSGDRWVLAAETGQEDAKADSRADSVVATGG